jgi:outer membrane receptor protein involved in Fe transport
MIREILRYSFIVLLTCCAHNILSAQTITLQARIKDENNKPLTHATASLFANDKHVATTISDTNGHFTLIAPLHREYKLKLDHTGYLSFTKIISLQTNTDLGNIALLPGTKTLTDVTVQSKQNIVEVEANTIIYNVSKTIDAAGQTALETLKKAPGVFVDNNSIITLNGRAGVMIMLDGKQTYLSGKELVDLLQSMPSSSIRSIEIMNSPGAKYDAAGTAGIINIKTQKLQLKGLNGTATAGMSFGITPKTNLDLSFNYRKNKANWFFLYNHFIGHYNYDYGSDRNQSTRTYNSITGDTDKRNRINSRMGMDYTLDAKHTFGFMVSANFIPGGGITDTRTIISLPNSGTTDKILDAVNDYYMQNTQRYNVNGNYKYEDKRGNVLNIDADYGYFKKENANLQSNTYTGLQQQLLSRSLYRTLNDINIQLKAFKADHTTNVFKGKLESGFKYAEVTADNGGKFYHINNSTDSFDIRRSNCFRFKESIASAYLNYKGSTKKWSYQFGVRMEHTDADGSLFFTYQGKDSTQRNPRNYTNFFPSFSISVKPSADHNFSFAYARRIDRPAYPDLNPFVYLLDELSFWQGNPFLQPQLSHRINLQYVYKSATIVGLSFGFTDHYSARITDTVDINKIVFIPRNLGKQNSIALTLTQNIAMQKWWDITLNASLTHIHNKIAFDAYRNFELKQFAARMNLSNRLRLGNNYTAEIIGSFNSRRLGSSNELNSATSTVDLALQKGFANNKYLLRIVLSDIYQGSRLTSVQRMNDFYLRNFSYYETRMLRINFTYKITNKNATAVRNRVGALDAENARVR